MLWCSLVTLWMLWSTYVGPEVIGHCLFWGCSILSSKKTKILAVRPQHCPSEARRGPSGCSGGVQVSWQHHHPGPHIGQRDQFAYQQSCPYPQFLVQCCGAGRSSKHLVRCGCSRLYSLTLLYGSETWVPSAIHLKHMQAFIMGCLRVILG